MSNATARRGHGVSRAERRLLHRMRNAALARLDVLSACGRPLTPAERRQAAADSLLVAWAERRRLTPR